VGAAVQGAVLGGDVKDVLLLDVTPLTLGIETLGRVFTRMIPRNTTIPTKKTEVYSTASDNQGSVEIHVLQGEREMASDNRTLGRFQLSGIPPAPRGVPKVEVIFDIDANGILHVSAKDLGTGQQQAITITGHSGLDEREINRLVKDAEAHTQDDQMRREVVEAKNQADQLIYGLEKVLRDGRDRIPADDAQRAREEIENTKQAVDGENLERIRSALESLSKVSHQITEKVYRQTGPGAVPNAGPQEGAREYPGQESFSSGTPGAEEVVDAEVVDGEKGH
jgi:molecular chaperone DnaK